LARLVVKWLVSRSRTDDFLGDLIGRILSYVIVTFGLAYALDVFGIAIAPILGALGIAGIALAFALQDILENFVAGVILQARRPFTAGDEVVVSDQEGSVVSIDACTITLHTPDGETVKVPSALVIKNSIVNHTQIGRRRTTVDVGVA
jgi:small conductance mechanosensitive channel